MTWLILISGRIIWLLLFKTLFDTLVVIPASTGHPSARDQSSSTWILYARITVTPVVSAGNISGEGTIWCINHGGRYVSIIQDHYSDHIC